ncbi:MAG: BatD family protein [gamma proteobacterium endosymbiont of Lamellibrachia anaximandri]|nr:BatD family protein [gamma proteobacterium endosymbiont of Lamellibrachia anaximandri]
MVKRLHAFPSILLLLLLAANAVAAPGGYPGYMPWQPPVNQWNYAPPDQRGKGTPSPELPPPTVHPPSYGPGGWPGMQRPGYSQTPYYGQQSRPPRLEIKLSGRAPYLQENLLLHLNIISDGNLKTATPQLPQTDALIFQKIEGPTASSRTRKGNQEIVTGFIYQVTPLRPGKIEIPPLHVTGTLESVSGYGSAPKAFDATSDKPLRLNVKDADPSINPWLPLEQLTLKTKLPENTRFAAGQPTSLTIEIKAIGASGDLLPSLERQLQSPDFRVYREKTRTQTNLSKSGKKIRGSRIETFTLVPQHGGDLQLPELRIPWWNIRTGMPQHASEPVKPLAVSGSGLRGEGLFGLTKPSTFFPAGSPAAFWIPLAVALGVIFGYWLAIWLANRKREVQPPAAFAPLTIALKRPFLSMAPAFAPLSRKLRATTACLNPITKWQRLRRRLVGMLPLSIRFWFCVRCVDQENDPDVWGYTLRFLANKHMDMPPRAPFADIADRIIAFQPRSNPQRVRGLVHDLDQAIYGHTKLNFEAWKRDFKREIRPGIPLLRTRRSGKKQGIDNRLPELNPKAVA